MKLLGMVALGLAFVLTAAPVFCETQAGPPAPTYVVHIPGLSASTMSPDEKWLAAVVVQQPKDAAPTAELQLWDFRSGSLVRAHSLPVPEQRPKYWKPFTYVSYTSDGELLAVYCGGDALRVLRASDLEEVRSLHIHSPSALEVSPTAHRIAVRTSGDVRVYDLDTGDGLKTWSVPSYPPFKTPPLLRLHPQLDSPSLAWRDDGRLLAIGVADEMPCLRGGGTIYTFDVASAEAAKSFRVPLLTAHIAFGTGNRLYVASNTCGGYLTHWALDLPIYDSATGQETGKIPAGRVGVRDYIAISANKRVLLAYADREKTTWAGFEDTLETKDQQWQVWELATEKLVLTLPAGERMPRGTTWGLSISGRLLYANRPREVLIFAVPDGAK